MQPKLCRIAARLARRPCLGTTRCSEWAFPDGFDGSPSKPLSVGGGSIVRTVDEDRYQSRGLAPWRACFGSLAVFSTAINAAVRSDRALNVSQQRPTTAAIRPWSRQQLLRPMARRPFQRFHWLLLWRNRRVKSQAHYQRRALFDCPRTYDNFWKAILASHSWVASWVAARPPIL